MKDFAFRWSRQRTAEVDQAIRQALADSATTVLDNASRLGIAFHGDLEVWRHELQIMDRAPPRLWACYHELVQAVARADQNAITASASTLLAGLPSPLPRAGSVVTIDDDHVGPGDVARYRAVIDNDAQRPLALVAATREEVARFTALTDEARSLLSDASPVLLDEIDTLGHEIVLAKSGGSRGFGGAATVFLWGAVMLNPSLVPDRVSLVESLAHETAHALLFGLTLGADLTTNEPSERYSSPLRPDPRPIEGIVHATYVLARMTFALDAISASLGLGERTLTQQKIDRNLKNYAAGLQTVKAHARFTREGAAIFKACQQAMELRGTKSQATK